MRSTPAFALETTAGLQSLEDRSSIKMLTQAAKFKTLTDHPMHSQDEQAKKGKAEEVQFYPW